MRTLFATLFIGALTAGSAGATGLEALGPDAACPSSIGSLSDSTGVVLGCWCAETGPAGSVWGSGPYTADSAVCSAARHAGQVPAGGGAILLQVLAGQASYAGSTKNGVTTGDWGSFGASISFVASQVATAQPPETAASCPSSMTGVTAPLRCSCDETNIGIATVWGTDIYTEDSSICRAAIHAGAIEATGGLLTAVPVDGQPSYTGSERFGIATQSYGSWGRSFIVTP